MELLIDLDSRPERSLRGRLEHALRDAVRTGRLAPGSRLPPTRALAAQLGVSRGVAVEAYAQLAAEGYLVTRRGGGTVVASLPAVPEPLHSPDRGRAARAAALRFDLRPGLPALADFPRRAWAAAVTRATNAAPDAAFGYDDGPGASQLRVALAEALPRTRGVAAAADRVVVTPGLRTGLHVLWLALAARGAARVGVEQPGWGGMAQTVEAAGLEAVQIPVDGDGLVVDALGDDLDAVVVTPAHQFPTGAALSADRRAALLRWARTHDALIVEDDYDAEYRYDRQPIGALQGLDPERVVYGGTASKSLAPVVQLGWLLVPGDLIDDVCRAQDAIGATPPILDQLAFADLLQRGELDRHLRRQRRRYRSRRDALLAALAERLPDVPAEGVAAGLHIVLRLPPGMDGDAAATAALARGIGVGTVDPGGPALVLGYANVPEASVATVANALADAVESVR